MQLQERRWDSRDKAGKQGCTMGDADSITWVGMGKEKMGWMGWVQMLQGRTESCTLFREIQHLGRVRTATAAWQGKELLTATSGE